MDHRLQIVARPTDAVSRRLDRVVELVDALTDELPTHGESLTLIESLMRILAGRRRELTATEAPIPPVAA